MLRKIKKPNIIHRIPQDIRHHTFGLSRIIYVLLLAFIVLLILHYLFYKYYLLFGDGFVDADAETVALEYDATVHEFLVENGDYVKKGQELFYFSSNDFRTQLLKAYTDYSSIVTKHRGAEANISRLKASIKASGDFLGDIEKVQSRLDELKKKGDVSMDRLLSEKSREFLVLRDYLTFQAELTSNLQSIQELSVVAESSTILIQTLIEDFEKGVKRASQDGVVGALNYYPGAVVKKTEPIVKLYSGARYITVLFEDSFISKKVGDFVIVSFDGGRHRAIGRIVDIGDYAAELPDEIKPRYRPPGRRAIARVLVDQEVLQSEEIMATAHICKPLGINLLCKIIHCDSKDQLLKNYENYEKQRDVKRRANVQSHQARNQEFVKSLTMPNKKEMVEKEETTKEETEKLLKSNP